MRSQVIKFRLASAGIRRYSNRKITPGIAKTTYPQAAKLTLGNAPAPSQKWNSVPSTRVPNSIRGRFWSASQPFGFAQYHRIFNLANSVVSS